MENSIDINKYSLLCYYPDNYKLDGLLAKELEFIKENFCGKTLTTSDEISECQNPAYVCGNIGEINKLFTGEKKIIRELSYNFGDELTVSIGQVPINLYGLGIYFRSVFDATPNYFDKISQEHQFQELSQSDKPGSSYRTGIYITPVERSNEQKRFHLLRCSTSLDGPTDNFRDTDHQIIDHLNQISDNFFTEKSEFNHVLAQIYHNRFVELNNKIVERKAKIKAHSDKTKDMQMNGLIVFCTFYENHNYRKSSHDCFDYLYKNKISVLSSLVFKLKYPDKYPHLPTEFVVKLYPNSVFVIPLSTNRLYTHETCPPLLPPDKFPKRLGYVARCSKTTAVYHNGQICIEKDGQLIELKEIDEEGNQRLRQLYYDENIKDEIINYEDFYFSMNSGDYLEPTE